MPITTWGGVLFQILYTHASKCLPSPVPYPMPILAIGLPKEWISIKARRAKTYVTLVHSLFTANQSVNR